MTVHLDLAGGGGQGAVDGLDGLGASGAEQPGQAEDLTGAHGQGDVVEPAGDVEPLDGELGGRLGGGVGAFEAGGALVGDLLDVSAEHQRDEAAPVEFGHGAGVDDAAVAQDGEVVADLPQLVEPVGDEDEGLAGVAQSADDGEEGLDLAALQGAGGLVHDDDVGLDGDGAGQGDHLLDAEAEGLEVGGDVDVESEAVKHLLGLAVHGAGVDEAQLGARLAAEVHVAGDRQLRDEIHLLVDRRDSGVLGVGGSVEAGGFAVEEDGSGLGLVDAGEHLDEGGLPGAVLSDEGVDRAGPDGEAHVVQGLDGAEAPGDVVRLESRSGAGRFRLR